jgi:hypothetical protein
MKIGVDLHGFMDSYSPVLKPLLVFMRGCFHPPVEIYVLSGPEKVQIKEELTKLGYTQGVHYDEIFSIVDFLKESKDPDLHQDEKGHWWTTEEKWFSSKAKFCIKEGIEVIFDDKIEYRRYMNLDFEKPVTIFFQIGKEKNELHHPKD